MMGFSHSTRLLAATTLRNVLGTKNLSDILSEREGISKLIKVDIQCETKCLASPYVHIEILTEPT